MTRREDATAASPSGGQLTISGGGTDAVIVTLGATLRTLAQDGSPLIDGFTEAEAIPYARGQLCVPWPNRIRDGVYTWDGVEIQAPLNEVSTRTALHGLVRNCIWEVRSHLPDAVVLGYRLCPQDGYPFLLDFEVSYAVSADGLVCTVSATNVGVDAAPYGFATHPYLSVGEHSIDDCFLQVDAATVVLCDERLLPREVIGVEGTPYDFRASGGLAGLDLDHALTDIRPHADGLSWATLWGPGRAEATSMWWEAASCRWFQVFTGDKLEGKWHRRGLAAEPMTCPPNAFQTGQDVIRLEPGDESVIRWGIRSGPQPGLVTSG
jgi:aldose 1-epimerase